MDGLPHFVPDRDSSRTLTEQLVDSVYGAVAAGAHVPGDVLPPTRRLAESSGDSRSVVVGAYERLIGENVLESRQGASTRVSEWMPDDEPDDIAGDAWADVPQLGQTVSAVLPAPDLRAGVEVPVSVGSFTHAPFGLL